MPRPNWFLAFPIDGAFVTELPKLPPHFRLFHPEDVHLTLAFLGGCGEAAALRASAALEAALSAQPLTAFSVSLGEVVPMGGSARSYTALSALPNDGRAAASSAIARLRDVLTDAAEQRRDLRPPKPHVSIARPRRQATDTDREAGLRWASGLDLAHLSARADRIALYTWHESRKDRLFERVGEHRLSESE